MDGWRQRTRTLVDKIHAVDPHYVPLTETVVRAPGLVSYADIAAGRSRSNSRCNSPFRNPRDEPPPSSPLTIQAIRLTTSKAEAYQKAKSESQIPTEELATEERDKTPARGPKVKSGKIDSSGHMDSRKVDQARRGRSPTRKPPSKPRKQETRTETPVQIKISQTEVFTSEHLEEKKMKGSLAPQEHTRGRSQSPMWIPGSTSYADILRGRMQANLSRASSETKEMVEMGRFTEFSKESSQAKSSQETQETQGPVAIEVAKATEDDVPDSIVRVAEQVPYQNVCQMSESSDVEKRRICHKESRDWSTETQTSDWADEPYETPIASQTQIYDYMQSTPELVGYISSQLGAYPVPSYVYAPAHQQVQGLEPMLLGSFEGPSGYSGDHYVTQGNYLPSGELYSPAQGPVAEKCLNQINELMQQPNLMQPLELLPQAELMQQHVFLSQPASVIQVQPQLITEEPQSALPIVEAPAFEKQENLVPSEKKDFQSGITETVQKGTVVVKHEASDNIETRGPSMSYAKMLSQGLSSRVTPPPTSRPSAATSKESSRSREMTPQDSKVFPKTTDLESSSVAQHKRENEWDTMKKRDVRKKTQEQKLKPEVEKKFKKGDKGVSSKPVPENVGVQKGQKGQEVKKKEEKVKKVDDRKEVQDDGKDLKKETKSDRKKDEKEERKIEEKVVETRTEINKKGKEVERTDVRKEVMLEKDKVIIEDSKHEQSEKKSKQKRKKVEKSNEDEIEKALKEIENMDKQKVKPKKEQLKAKKDKNEKVDNQKPDPLDEKILKSKEKPLTVKEKVDDQGTKAKEYSTEPVKEESKKIKGEKSVKSKDKSGKKIPTQKETVTTRESKVKIDSGDFIKQESKKVAETEGISDMATTGDKISVPEKETQISANQDSKADVKKKDKVKADKTKEKVTPEVSSEECKVKFDTIQKVETDDKSQNSKHESITPVLPEKETTRIRNEETKIDTAETECKNHTTEIGKSKNHKEKEKGKGTATASEKQIHFKGDTKTDKAKDVTSKISPDDIILDSDKSVKEYHKSEKSKESKLKEEFEPSSGKFIRESEDKSIKTSDLMVVTEVKKPDTKLSKSENKKSRKDKKSAKNEESKELKEIEESKVTAEERKTPTKSAGNTSSKQNTDRKQVPGSAFVDKSEDKVVFTEVVADKPVIQKSLEADSEETVSIKNESSESQLKGLVEKSVKKEDIKPSEDKNRRKGSKTDLCELNKPKESKEGEIPKNEQSSQIAKVVTKDKSEDLTEVMNFSGKALIIEKTVTTITTTTGSEEVKPPAVKSTKSIEILENVPLPKTKSSKGNEVISLRPENVEASIVTTYARVACDSVNESKVSETVDQAAKIGEVTLSSSNVAAPADFVLEIGEGDLFGSVKDRRKTHSVSVPKSDESLEMIMKERETESKTGSGTSVRIGTQEFIETTRQDIIPEKANSKNIGNKWEIKQEPKIKIAIEEKIREKTEEISDKEKNVQYYEELIKPYWLDYHAYAQAEVDFHRYYKVQKVVEDPHPPPSEPRSSSIDRFVQESIMKTPEVKSSKVKPIPDREMRISALAVETPKYCLSEINAAESEWESSRHRERVQSDEVSDISIVSDRTTIIERDINVEVTTKSVHEPVDKSTEKLKDNSVDKTVDKPKPVHLVSDDSWMDILDDDSLAMGDDDFNNVEGKESEPTSSEKTSMVKKVRKVQKTEIIAQGELEKKEEFKDLVRDEKKLTGEKAKLETKETLKEKEEAKGQKVHKKKETFKEMEEPKQKTTTSPQQKDLSEVQKLPDQKKVLQKKETETPYEKHSLKKNDTTKPKQEETAKETKGHEEKATASLEEKDLLKEKEAFKERDAPKGTGTTKKKEASEGKDFTIQEENETLKKKEASWQKNAPKEKDATKEKEIPNKEAPTEKDNTTHKGKEQSKVKGTHKENNAPTENQAPKLQETPKEKEKRKDKEVSKVKEMPHEKPKEKPTSKVNEASQEKEGPHVDGAYKKKDAPKVNETTKEKKTPVEKEVIKELPKERDVSPTKETEKLIKKEIINDKKAPKKKESSKNEELKTTDVPKTTVITKEKEVSKEKEILEKIKPSETKDSLKEKQRPQVKEPTSSEKTSSVHLVADDSWMDILDDDSLAIDDDFDDTIVNVSQKSAAVTISQETKSKKQEKGITVSEKKVTSVVQQKNDSKSDVKMKKKDSLAASDKINKEKENKDLKPVKKEPANEQNSPAVSDQLSKENKTKDIKPVEKAPEKEKDLPKAIQLSTQISKAVHLVADDSWMDILDDDTLIIEDDGFEDSESKPLKPSKDTKLGKKVDEIKPLTSKEKMKGKEQKEESKAEASKDEKVTKPVNKADDESTKSKEKCKKIHEKFVTAEKVVSQIAEISSQEVPKEKNIPAVQVGKDTMKKSKNNQSSKQKNESVNTESELQASEKSSIDMTDSSKPESSEKLPLEPKSEITKSSPVLSKEENVGKDRKDKKGKGKKQTPKPEIRESEKSVEVIQKTDKVIPAKEEKPFVSQLNPNAKSWASIVGIKDSNEVQESEKAKSITPVVTPVATSDITLEVTIADQKVSEKAVEPIPVKQEQEKQPSQKKKKKQVDSSSKQKQTIDKQIPEESSKIDTSVSHETIPKDWNKSYAEVAAKSATSSPQPDQEEREIIKPNAIKADFKESQIEGANVSLLPRIDIRTDDSSEVQKDAGHDIKEEENKPKGFKKPPIVDKSSVAENLPSIKMVDTKTIWADEVEAEVQITSEPPMTVTETKVECVPKLDNSSWATIAAKKSKDAQDAIEKTEVPISTLVQRPVPQIQIHVQEAPVVEPIENLVQVDDQGFMEFVNRKELRCRRSRSRSRNRSQTRNKSANHSSDRPEDVKTDLRKEKQSLESSNKTDEVGSPSKKVRSKKGKGEEKRNNDTEDKKKSEVEKQESKADKKEPEAQKQIDSVSAKLVQKSAKEEDIDQSGESKKSKTKSKNKKGKDEPRTPTPKEKAVVKDLKKEKDIQDKVTSMEVTKDQRTGDKPDIPIVDAKRVHKSKTVTEDLNKTVQVRESIKDSEVEKKKKKKHDKSVQQKADVESDVQILKTEEKNDSKKLEKDYVETVMDAQKPQIKGVESKTQSISKQKCAHASKKEIDTISKKTDESVRKEEKVRGGKFEKSKIEAVKVEANDEKVQDKEASSNKNKQKTKGKRLKYDEKKEVVCKIHKKSPTTTEPESDDNVSFKTAVLVTQVEVLIDKTKPASVPNEPMKAIMPLKKLVLTQEKAKIEPHKESKQSTSKKTGQFETVINVESEFKVEKEVTEGKKVNGSAIYTNVTSESSTPDLKPASEVTALEDVKPSVSAKSDNIKTPVSQESSEKSKTDKYFVPEKPDTIKSSLSEKPATIESFVSEKSDTVKSPASEKSAPIPVKSDTTKPPATAKADTVKSSVSEKTEIIRVSSSDTPDTIKSPISEKSDISKTTVYETSETSKSSAPLKSDTTNQKGPTEDDNLPTDEFPTITVPSTNEELVVQIQEAIEESVDHEPITYNQKESIPTETFTTPKTDSIKHTKLEIPKIEEPKTETETQVQTILKGPDSPKVLESKKVSFSDSVEMPPKAVSLPAIPSDSIDKSPSPDVLPKTKVQFYIADEILVIPQHKEKDLEKESKLVKLMQESHAPGTIWPKFASLDGGFWIDKRPYHEAERDLFEALAYRSKQPTLIENFDQNPPKDDDSNDGSSGGGGGGQSSNEKTSSHFDVPHTERLVADLPGGICSWSDYSTYLSHESIDDQDDQKLDLLVNRMTEDLATDVESSEVDFSSVESAKVESTKVESTQVESSKVKTSTEDTFNPILSILKSSTDPESYPDSQLHLGKERSGSNQQPSSLELEGDMVSMKTELKSIEKIKVRLISPKSDRSCYTLHNTCCF